MSQAQKQPVQLSLTTKITQAGEVETFVFDTAGELLLKDGQIFLRYTETIGEQQTQVRFKFEAAAVHLHRSGDGQIKLVFRPEKHVPAFYQTPAGQMQLTTYTTMLQVDVDAHTGQGQAVIAYQLLANAALIGEYELRLQFHAKSSKLN